MENSSQDVKLSNDQTKDDSSSYHVSSNFMNENHTLDKNFQWYDWG
jgi:hypothetical protein